VEYVVMKIKDHFLNHINLFGETDVVRCEECKEVIKGKVYRFFEYTFCSAYCKYSYEDKLK